MLNTNGIIGTYTGNGNGIIGSGEVHVPGLTSDDLHENSRYTKCDNLQGIVSCYFPKVSSSLTGGRSGLQKAGPKSDPSYPTF